MTFVLSGEILTVDNSKVTVRNLVNDELVNLNWVDTEVKPEVGLTGVFGGIYQNNFFQADFVRFRKFLNPISEADILNLSAGSGSKVLHQAFIEAVEQLKSE